MTVYVDQGRYPYRNMIMSHMIGTDLAELHAMAERLGLRRYFQSASIPHYDCCQKKRAVAISHGAVVIDRRQAARLVRAWRERLADPGLPQDRITLIGVIPALGEAVAEDSRGRLGSA